MVMNLTPARASSVVAVGNEKKKNDTDVRLK